MLCNTLGTSRSHIGSTDKSACIAESMGKVLPLGCRVAICQYCDSGAVSLILKFCGIYTSSDHWRYSVEKFIRKSLLIQGGGPCRPSPKRHRSLGRWDAKRITISQRECSLYTCPTLDRRNRAQKHTKQSPRPRGTHTGHTTWKWSSKQSNNPPDHASFVVL